jgi:glycosyltransferase involved in cell wall biosynthesis
MLDGVARIGGVRILVVTDAWLPQVNGVVRTLSTVAGELRAMGHLVEIVGPDRFRTLPCPTYPDIRLSVLPARRLSSIIAAFAPDRLHIATEGPLGLAARRWAIRRGHAFTTSFHTRFPEYIQARTGLPVGLAYAFLRRFHNAGSATMVATASLRRDLAARGFSNLSGWSRGVALDRFLPEPRRDWAAEYGLARPVFLYVGRIAVEKNIPAFLDLDLPGSKVVVGGGPQLAALKARYPGVVFTGPFSEDELSAAYAGGSGSAGGRGAGRGVRRHRAGGYSGRNRWAGRGGVRRSTRGSTRGAGCGSGGMPGACGAVCLAGVRGNVP